MKPKVDLLKKKKIKKTDKPLVRLTKGLKKKKTHYENQE